MSHLAMIFFALVTCAIAAPPETPEAIAKEILM